MIMNRLSSTMWWWPTPAENFIKKKTMSLQSPTHFASGQKYQVRDKYFLSRVESGQKIVAHFAMSRSETNRRERTRMATSNNICQSVQFHWVSNLLPTAHISCWCWRSAADHLSTRIESVLVRWHQVIQFRQVSVCFGHSYLWLLL